MASTDTSTHHHTIFEALRRDHDIQRTLVDRLITSGAASDGRNETFAELRNELEAHAAAEARYFYAPLIGVDATQSAAQNSVAEHQEIDDHIEKLDGYDLSGPQWVLTVQELADRLVHHLDEEERVVFPAAEAALDDDQKIALAAEYEEYMQRRR